MDSLWNAYVTWQERTATTGLRYEIMFFVVYGKMFILIDSLLSSRGTSHILNIPLTLEWFRIQFWLTSFSYINCLPDDVQCKIAIWAEDTNLNSTCDKLSYLVGIKLRLIASFLSAPLLYN